MGRWVLVGTLQANVVGQVVVGATTLTGEGKTTIGKITTTTTTYLISTMTNPTMEPPTTVGTMAMAEIAPRVLVSFVVRLGIKPSSALKPKASVLLFPREKIQ